MDQVGRVQDYQPPRLTFKQQASLLIPLSVRAHAVEEAPLDWAMVDPKMLEKQEAKL